MHDPYLIDGPALISFSGGRTSAYLLKHILDANGGTLPADVVPCFANTGREMPETLDFVRDCSERWNVPVVWLEFDPAWGKQRRFRVVDHAAASRAGEPARADWWIAMEALPKNSKPTGSTFRIDRPDYAAMKRAALARRGLDFGEADALADCFCHE